MSTKFTVTMTDVRVTQQQLDMMRNATGGKRNGYRNRYTTAPDIDSYAPWQELETMGLATRDTPQRSDYVTFRVTEAGMRMVYGQPKPSPTECSTCGHFLPAGASSLSCRMCDQS